MSWRERIVRKLVKGAEGWQLQRTASKSLGDKLHSLLEQQNSCWWVGVGVGKMDLGKVFHNLNIHWEGLLVAFKMFNVPFTRKSRLKRRWGGEVRAIQASSWWTFFQKPTAETWKKLTWRYFSGLELLSQGILQRQNIVLGDSFENGRLSRCFCLCPVSQPTVTRVSLMPLTELEWVFLGPLVRKLHWGKMIWFQYCNHFCITSKSKTPEADRTNSSQMDLGKAGHARGHRKVLWTPISEYSYRKFNGGHLVHRENISGRGLRKHLPPDQGPLKECWDTKLVGFSVDALGEAQGYETRVVFRVILRHEKCSNLVNDQKEDRKIAFFFGTYDKLESVHKRIYSPTENVQNHTRREGRVKLFPYCLLW